MHNSLAKFKCTFDAKKFKYCNTPDSRYTIRRTKENELSQNINYYEYPNWVT